MKKVLVWLPIFLLFSSITFAQFAELDNSPMDMAYFPHNFAHDRKAGDKPLVRVVYSRHAKNNRVVMGKLVPFGKIWRAGANEATEIKFYEPVQLAGKIVQPGTYSFFAIPGEKEWTIILNSDLDYWGAYSYKEKNDVLRVTAPTSELNNVVEHFTIQFEKKGDHAGTMRMAWDKTVAEVPFTY